MRPQLRDGFAWIEASGPSEASGQRLLLCRPLNQVARHLFTTREWALGVAQPEPDLASAWGEVAEALGVPPDRLVRMRQVHGASVVVHHAGQTPAVAAEADIIMTDDPSTAIAIQTADCVPLLMADARTGVVAAAHAGWRGLAAGVPSVAVDALARSFDVHPADLVVAMGPSISAACYEVGLDVRRTFESTPFADRLDAWFPKMTRPGHWLFDGWQAARDQLVGAGVHVDAIHSSELCTFTNADTCCSYRRDGKAAGRMAAAIRVRC
jgi:YfiH family protein